MQAVNRLRPIATRLIAHRSARNVVWNLLGGLSLGVMTVLATPVYVAKLGLEGYGVVGLWLVMQVMIGLLDMGLGASVVRSFAGSPSGEAGSVYRRDLLRTLEAFYWVVGLLVMVALALSARVVASHWLKTSALPDREVARAIQLMAVALGFQFASVVYANGLSGLQAQGMMNALQTGGNVFRYGGGVLVLLWRANLPSFFLAQAIIAAAQTLIMRAVLWHLIVQDSRDRPVVRMELVRQLWRYSLGMAVSSAAAVMMSNSDRIAVGSLLPATELGKYSVAFTATGLLQLGIQPFYRAFFPRYSELVARGEETRLRTEYFRSCQLVGACVIPLLIGGWLFAPQLLSAWLGRSDPTITAVFRCLLIGVSCAGLVWLPAALQQASGWTKLHAGMIIAALVIGTPLMIVAIRRFGTVGATTVWLVHGLSGITIELSLMHRRILPGDLGSWYRRVIALPLVIAIPVIGGSYLAMPAVLGRWTALSWVGLTTVFAVGSVLLVMWRWMRDAEPATATPTL